MRCCYHHRMDSAPLELQEVAELQAGFVAAIEQGRLPEVQLMRHFEHARMQLQQEERTTAAPMHLQVA